MMTVEPLPRSLNMKKDYILGKKAQVGKTIPLEITVGRLGQVFCSCLATPFLQTDQKFGKFFSTFWVGCMVRFETLTFEISSFLSRQSDWPTLLGTLKSIWKSICRSLCGDTKSTCREFYVCCILFSFSFVSSFVTISALQAS